MDSVGELTRVQAVSGDLFYTDGDWFDIKQTQKEGWRRQEETPTVTIMVDGEKVTAPISIETANRRLLSLSYCLLLREGECGEHR